MKKYSLKLEAEAIIAELNILPLLRTFGRAEIVGSVAFDLIVKRDIDLHLLINDNKKYGITVALIAQTLVEHPKVEDSVLIKTYPEQDGTNIAIEEYQGSSGKWSIDCWITTNPAYAGFERVAHMQKILTPELRTIIMKIKQAVHRRGQLHHGMSTKIYDAVLEHGVDSVNTFDLYCKKNCPIS